LIKKTLPIFLMLAMLAGCAQFNTPADYWIKPGHSIPSGRAVALLYYADYLRELSQADYVREVNHAQQLYASEKSDFRLLQYVLAISIPGSDLHRAQLVLEPLVRDGKGHDPELYALASLINNDLAERRRLELGTRRAEAGAKRADDLEKKVEALKSIEKNLIQRDAGTEEKQ
jgi:hypothetical protein